MTSNSQTNPSNRSELVCPVCEQPLCRIEVGAPDDLVRCGCTVVSLEWLRLASTTQGNRSELVERVARSICKARGGNPDECVSGYSWAAGEMGKATGGSVCHKRNWEYHAASAEAAIAAIRGGSA